MRNMPAIALHHLFRVHAHVFHAITCFAHHSGDTTSGKILRTLFDKPNDAKRRVSDL